MPDPRAGCERRERRDPSRLTRRAVRIPIAGMTLRIYQVDAFTDVPFRGNPAAVCPLPEARSEAWMRDVAREMNLSETSFLVRRADGAFDLRWFTPAAEVALCGHATLASAHVLWETGTIAAGETARFHTKSGLLTAERRPDGLIEPGLSRRAPRRLRPRRTGSSTPSARPRCSSGGARRTTSSSLRRRRRCASSRPTCTGCARCPCEG